MTLLLFALYTIACIAAQTFEAVEGLGSIFSTCATHQHLLNLANRSFK
jgi:hypothetical protein